MDLRDLYQDVILDHGKNPRNHQLPEPHNREGRGHNPLCGDRIVLRLFVEGGVIQSIGFRGDGCAISQASCSTMTVALKGKTVEEAELLFRNFHALITGEGVVDESTLGKLTVFGGVGEFPMRVKCATLAWHTLMQALSGDTSVAKTEA